MVTQDLLVLVMIEFWIAERERVQRGRDVSKSEVSEVDDASELQHDSLGRQTNENFLTCPQSIVFMDERVHNRVDSKQASEEI